MMKRTSALLVCAVAAFSLGGCIDTNFDRPSLVKSPRVLAIVASPPEIGIGQDVVFEALLVDASGASLTDDPALELSWSVCAGPGELLASLGLETGLALEDDCGEGGADRIDLDSSGLQPHQARLSGTQLLAAVMRLMGGMGGMGGEESPIPPEIQQTALFAVQQVGVALRVRLRVERDGERLFDSFKRFAFVTRDNPTTNPPAPRFAIDGVFYSARGAADERECVPEEGEPAQITAGEAILFAPDVNDEEWAEDYPVFDYSGGLQINTEGAFYSYFATAGEFSDDVTAAPNRDSEWTAPDEATTVTTWVVVRDGHLGTSYCRAEFEVVAP